MDAHPRSGIPAPSALRPLPGLAAWSVRVMGPVRSPVPSRVRGLVLGLLPALALVLALALALLPSTVAAQERMVAGVVTDARTLAPVAGAQVSIEGTSVGGLTDAGGRFRITGIPGAGESATVRVQFIGYQTSTQVVRVGDTTLRFTLSQAAIELDALVVTGTAGAVQRRAIGNLVTQIDAASVTEIAPIPDVAMLLNARAPGVVVQPGSGMVGGGSRIRIRGASSFSLNDQPLI